MSDCPITLFTALMHSNLKPMTENDLEGFAGIEYEGFIGEYEELLVVVDNGPTLIVEIYEVNSDKRWSFQVANTWFE